MPVGHGMDRTGDDERDIRRTRIQTVDGSFEMGHAGTDTAFEDDLTMAVKEMALGRGVGAETDVEIGGNGWVRTSKGNVGFARGRNVGFASRPNTDLRDAGWVGRCHAGLVGLGAAWGS